MMKVNMSCAIPSAPGSYFKHKYWQTSLIISELFVLPHTPETSENQSWQNVCAGHLSQHLTFSLTFTH